MTDGDSLLICPLFFAICIEPSRKLELGDIFDKDNMIEYLSKSLKT